MSSQIRVLHVGDAKKFLSSYWKFLARHFGDLQHERLVLRRQVASDLPSIRNIRASNKWVWALRFILLGWRADVIVIHGLKHEIAFVLCLFPNLARKCRWVLLGGDVYYYRDRPKRPKAALYELARTIAIRRIPLFLSIFRGEYELLKQWYQVPGRFHECLMYPNVFSMPVLPAPAAGQESDESAFTFMVGNAARSGNRHLECLEQLAALGRSDVRIICPLSYGNPAYAREVKTRGRELFGDRFVALEDYLDLDEYARILRGVDAALFGVDRQQSMATVLLLLSLGAKVYIRDDITPYAFFQDLGVRVYPLNEVDGMALDPELAAENIRRIRSFFSEENAVAQWREAFRPEI